MRLQLLGEARFRQEHVYTSLQCARARLFLEASGRGDAVELRHGEVHDDDVWPQVGRDVHGGFIGFIPSTRCSGTFEAAVDSRLY